MKQDSSAVLLSVRSNCVTSCNIGSRVQGYTQVSNYLPYSTEQPIPLQNRVSDNSYQLLDTYRVSQSRGDQPIWGQPRVHSCNPDLPQCQFIGRHSRSWVVTSRSGCSASMRARPDSDASTTSSFILLTVSCDAMDDRLKGCYPPGIPQSSNMDKAAHAVPPVATSGSRRNTASTVGFGGSLE